MKKKGFTLMELLAVVVILGIIALIAVVSVNSTISNTKDSLSERQIENIEEAAKSYYLKEGMNIDDKCVNVSELIEKGYVEENKILDPKTKEEMTGSVKITYASNQYSYEYQDFSCLFENGEVVYFDVTTGEVCTNYHEDNSKTGYNGITKTTANQNGCLKFYAFNNKKGDERVNLLLDHNTTDAEYWTQAGGNTSEGDNTNGPIELLSTLKTDTNNWAGTETPNDYTHKIGYTIPYKIQNYKARLITAQEIAQIAQIENFNEDDAFGYDIDKNKYGWLLDNDHYWTSSASLNFKNSVWQVGPVQIYSWYSFATEKQGVRPVIEVLKSKLQ